MVPAPNAYGLEQRDILGVPGYLRPSDREGTMRKCEYIYNVETNTYCCPPAQVLCYATA